ncbi:AraC family transcriptional regulator [Nocardioides currus]|uniref:AraC family transcriptional regulator n=2 Tax=Nocardioides currus TaxID=2133958 RepID=A0A2R7Z0X7_9ACTN|nr:AraC family transcriptional regulator [Nocardioides currus]
MDMLEVMLEGPRARGAFLLRSLLEPPWSLRIEDEAALAVVSVTRGTAWLLTDAGERHELGAGDLAIVRGPGHYTACDRPSTPPSIVIGPGGECSSSADGSPLAEVWGRGVRTWGPGERGDTVLLTGTYEDAGETGRPLLAALPDVVVLRRDAWPSTLPDLLAQEATIDAPGQRAVLDRLLDVVLISALRTWFAGRAEEAPGWFRAQGDPVVGTVLGLLEAAPERAWTVSELADRVGVSRAALGRRFTELLGQPPIAYLTQRRLQLAADLLLESDATLPTIARRVGYGSPFALSAAFKREFGRSPQEHRRGGLGARTAVGG